MTTRFKTSSRFGLKGVVVIAFGFGLAACNMTAPSIDGTSTPVATLSPSEAVALRLEVSPEAAARLNASGISASSFGRSVKDAVAAHPELARAQYSIVAGEASRDGAGAYIRPQVSVGAEAIAATSGSGISTSATPVFRVSQLLYDGGAGHYGTVAADERVAAARANYAQTASALAFRAVEAKIAYWNASQLSRVASERLSVINHFIEQVEERLASGVGTESEITLGRSRLASARARRIEVQQQLAIARADHTEIFGVPPGSGGGLPPVAPVTNSTGSPRLVSLDFTVNSALFALEQARAQRMPGISLGLSARPPGALSGGVRAELGVNYALSSGGARAAAIREAEATLNAIRAEREGVSRQIGRSVATARSGTRAARERVTAARLSVEANSDALTSITDQFAIGRSDLTSVLDAQRDRSAAQESLIIARSEQVRQSYLALSITGEILPLFGVQIPALGADLAAAE